MPHRYREDGDQETQEDQDAEGQSLPAGGEDELEGESTSDDTEGQSFPKLRRGGEPGEDGEVLENRDGGDLEGQSLRRGRDDGDVEGHISRRG